MLLSLVLFICDQRYNFFENIKDKSSSIIIPIKKLVNWPIASTRSITENFEDKKSIAKKNKELQEELLITKAKLQQLDFLEYENLKLRSLLNHSKQIQNKIVPAKLFAPSTNNFGQQIIINKGKKEKAYTGQPVLDAHGLLGQIISTQNKTSKVLLITSKKSAIPVMIIRNGLQTIAMGTGGDNLKLANIPETADVRTGDFVVTSNLGEHFPAGYHVGTIKKVNRVLGERFMQVSVAPKANINDIMHILLVWPENDLANENNQFLK